MIKAPSKVYYSVLGGGINSETKLTRWYDLIVHMNVHVSRQKILGSACMHTSHSLLSNSTDGVIDVT